MGRIRNFTGPEGHFPPVRNIEHDAPHPMRQELIDLFFNLAEQQNPNVVNEDKLYRVIHQSLGFSVSGNPYGGYRYKCSGAIRAVEWARVYDLICRLWPEFAAEFGEEYADGVNRILAAYGIAWDLGEDGLLHRVLPEPAQAHVIAAFQELNDPQYAAARPLLDSARDAYDDRPRRERDACTNAFDAMESVAKTKYHLPQATFGHVVAHIRNQPQPPYSAETIETLARLNDLRNHHFGHGMVTPFQLSPQEVDFAYLSCIAGILLFVRTP